MFLGRKEDESVKDYWERIQEDSKRISRLEDICISPGADRAIGIDERVIELEERLDILMAYLELEEFTPDCTPVLRKKEKVND
jgi:hypothetical protein